MPTAQSTTNNFVANSCCIDIHAIMFRFTFISILVLYLPWTSTGIDEEYTDSNQIDVLFWFNDEFIPIKESIYPINKSDNETVYNLPSFDYDIQQLDNASTTTRQLKPSKNPKLSSRDQSWLDSHNKRRKAYHTKYKTSYTPLKWSDGLKKEAEKWAKQLAQKCGNRGVLVHDPKTDYGENLASGYGKELPSTDNVLERWVEREENDGELYFVMSLRFIDNTYLALNPLQIIPTTGTTHRYYGEQRNMLDVTMPRPR
jgi:hypothetical protein